jgi:hypothetical protein
MQDSRSVGKSAGVLVIALVFCTGALATNAAAQTSYSIAVSEDAQQFTLYKDSKTFASGTCNELKSSLTESILQHYSKDLKNAGCDVSEPEPTPEFHVDEPNLTPPQLDGPIIQLLPAP